MLVNNLHNENRLACERLWVGFVFSSQPKVCFHVRHMVLMRPFPQVHGGGLSASPGLLEFIWYRTSLTAPNLSS